MFNDTDKMDTALRQWTRYQQVRDLGHHDFIKKADRCNDFFTGNQWNPIDKATLALARRPALTINKILSTIGNVMGEQIQNRTDISFQPRSGAPVETAETLTKVFRQIADSNQLDWKRTDVFCDGIISSRGFFDTRLDFTDSMQGEVRIDRLNPKNVLIDPDAEDYDPDTWNDVMTTKWMTWQDIEMLYGKDKAEALKGRGSSMFAYGSDSIDEERDRFGRPRSDSAYLNAGVDTSVVRNIRVIERQYKKLTRQEHFVDLATGDLRPVPDTWDKERIAMAQQQFSLGITKKLVKRIKWVVTADNIVLHDEWSPYKHFTVIPYFPHFRHGQTIGLVENLLDPQEYLNKVTSQELHVINTTANSGWKVKTGAMTNMSIEELETRGAETGLVVELTDMDGLDKITPYPTPTGLDRFSYKAEEHIKSISGVTDYQTGNAREDVSAKAVALNQNRGSLNLAGPSDALQRTDFMLARNVLDMVQEYYTEPRILNITANRLTGDVDQVEVNTPDPTTGSITNDLTVGEFDVIVSNTPARETLEDSQFDQAMALREAGVEIPDETLIENSRLNRRSDIIKQMRDAAEGPEAKARAELQQKDAELEMAKKKAEGDKAAADAELKTAKAQMEQLQIQIEQQGGDDDTQEKQAALMEQMQQAQIRSREADEDFRRQQQDFIQSMEEFNEKMRQNEEEHDQGITQDQETHDLAMKHKDEQNKATIAAKKAAAAAKPAPSKTGDK
jgi:hypothetical protein